MLKYEGAAQEAKFVTLLNIKYKIIQTKSNCFRYTSLRALCSDIFK